MEPTEFKPDVLTFTTAVETRVAGNGGLPVGGSLELGRSGGIFIGRPRKDTHRPIDVQEQRLGDAPVTSVSTLHPRVRRFL